MNDYKTLYKSLLKEYAKFSTCSRLKVACLLVNDGRILSCGYNGVPAHDMHCEDRFTQEDGKYFIDKEEVTRDEWYRRHHEFSEESELHAELNCLMFALKNKLDVSKCDIVVSIAPCMNCAKMILSSGIKRVYYVEGYDRSMAGIEFLKKHGIITEKI